MADISLNLLVPTADLIHKQAVLQYFTKKSKDYLTAYGIQVATDLLSNTINNSFGNSLLGLNLATMFSTGLNSTGNTIMNNFVKGDSLFQGLGLDVGTSLANAGIGIGANYVGQGITSLMGNSMLGRFTGLTAATTLANGKNLLNSIKAINAAKNATKATDTISKAANLGKANLVGLGMSAVGAGLGAAFGPSHEYNGRYGNITKTMDTVYDSIAGAAGFVPGAGTIVSGAMILNKGLSNVFGSTDGMTKTDAILGSAFMPAPVKWINAGFGKTTDTFNNQSWQNLERADTFMQNGFGDLYTKFDKAREESNKKYGLFSQHARRKADRNIAFANTAWDLILDMANLNEYLNIRAEDMASINNQRYALMISGGYNPMLVGKQGMKILNNATNHNIGMRLLSGAALIDNKQMILCNV